MSEPEAIRLRTEYTPAGSRRVNLDQATWPQSTRIADALLLSGPYLTTSSPGLDSHVGDRLTITLANARAVYRLERYRDLYEDWDAVLIEGEVRPCGTCPTTSAGS